MGILREPDLKLSTDERPWNKAQAVFLCHARICQGRETLDIRRCDDQLAQDDEATNGEETIGKRDRSKEEAKRCGLFGTPLGELAACWESGGIGFRLAADYRKAQKRRRGYLVKP